MLKQKGKKKVKPQQCWSVGATNRGGYWTKDPGVNKLASKGKQATANRPQPRPAHRQAIWKGNQAVKCSLAINYAFLQGAAGSARVTFPAIIRHKK